MATRAAAASTHSPAAEAASQAFLVEPGDAPATAIDALLAGVMALAARHPSVLLSSGAILLGGTGEGLIAIDGRARQPGREAPRPRGFTDLASVPDAAKIAAPLLPAALMLAHAGRGVRTRTAMMNLGVAAARATTTIDDARVESLRAFGREGGAILRAGPIREALLAAGARSVGGTLTREDLDALVADASPARVESIGPRTWARTPWSDDEVPGELAIVAACDTHGALAIAAILIPTFTAPLPELGLAIPLLARPVLRGVTRDAAGVPLPLAAPIGISKSGDTADLAVGIGAPSAFADLMSSIGEALAIDDAIARVAEHRVAGVMFDSRARGRALSR